MVNRRKYEKGNQFGHYLRTAVIFWKQSGSRNFPSFLSPFRLPGWKPQSLSEKIDEIVSADHQKAFSRKQWRKERCTHFIQNASPANCPVTLAPCRDKWDGATHESREGDRATNGQLSRASKWGPYRRINLQPPPSGAARRLTGDPSLGGQRERQFGGCTPIPVVFRKNNDW